MKNLRELGLALDKVSRTPLPLRSASIMVVVFGVLLGASAFAQHTTPGAGNPANLTRDDCVTGKCHGQWGPDAKIYHQPLREGPCTDCHIPDSDYDPEKHDIFTFSFPDLKAQCLACHDSVAETLVDGKQVHKPADAGVCESCHDPHGNREEVFLLPPDRKGEGTARGLWLSRGLNPQCVSCHGIDPFGGKDASETQFRDGARNLHWLHLRVVEREIECVQCHEPHAGGQGKLMR